MACGSRDHGHGRNTIMTNILFVDDESSVLQGIQRTLRGKFTIDTADSGAAGLEALQKRGPFAVVVSDMRMPGMDGVEFLSRVKDLAPDTIRVMLTGNSDLETAVRAVNQGAIFRFANKPCPPEMLIPLLEAARRQHQLVTAEKQLLEDTLGGCIRVLTEILSLADGRQFARATALQDLTRRVTRSLAMPDAWQINAAAMLAQIGTVAIPPVVLVRAREGKTLAGAEKDMLTRIPDTGHDLLRHVPRLETVASIVKYQHKNLDGTGYPADSQKGADIPVGARLLRILGDVVTKQQEGDSVDSIVKDLRSHPEQFDQQMVDAVVRVLQEKDGARSQDAMTTEVTLRELQVGHVLAANVVTAENTVLVVPGTKITFVLRERLLNFAKTVGVREPILVHAVAVPAGAAP